VLLAWQPPVTGTAGMMPPKWPTRTGPLTCGAQALGACDDALAAAGAAAVSRPANTRVRVAPQTESPVCSLHPVLRHPRRTPRLSAAAVTKVLGWAHAFALACSGFPGARWKTPHMGTPYSARSGSLAKPHERPMILTLCQPSVAGQRVTSVRSWAV